MGGRESLLVFKIGISYRRVDNILLEVISMIGGRVKDCYEWITSWVRDQFRNGDGPNLSDNIRHPLR